MKDSNNKVAVITGGNSGIGYAAAKRFKASGANVIITGRRKDAVEKVAAELRVTGLVADQSKLPDIEHLVRQVKEQFGKVDTLLVNAGFTKF